MEEELNENELEERLYSMLHYADETQENLNINQKDVLQIVENKTRNVIPRYWRDNEDHSVYRRSNTSKVAPANKSSVKEKTDSKSSTEKHDVGPSLPSNNVLSIFQTPVSQNLKKIIEIVEEEKMQIVALESSDEDEVIEVVLPPKPTITIESSDEEELCATTEVEPKHLIEDTKSPGKKSPNERDIIASPVPSIVSSVSDEFIRGDCIALNISSRHPNNQSFDFSLHGSDLLDQTPSKKKKRKKNKLIIHQHQANTSTPIASVTPNVPTAMNDKGDCFATPKSKAKNKKHKNKSYTVSEKSLPNPDVYDSDSNQSASELNKNPNTDSSKSADVPLIDSDTSKVANSNQTSDSKETSEITLSKDKEEVVPSQALKRNDNCVVETTDIVDLTGSAQEDTSLISIDENIVMGNISGLPEMEEYDMTPPANDAPKFGSTKVPDILYADLDFNNLNGKECDSKKRCYSYTTLRAEMEKFYNESWGGENFNHREIQKYMSRDKSLWVIDPKDRISALTKRKVTCNYCNRPGHRDDTCRLKPPVCYMCGSIGHNEPRCPSKICVNCGSPNRMYCSMCRNCFHWQNLICGECGQEGHPDSHCPDLWRRYHNTISENTPLEENHQFKKHYQMFCSGCTRRGHLVHACRFTVPFSGLPINSPYVNLYNPVFPPSNVNQFSEPRPGQPASQHRNIQQDNTISSDSITHRTERNKRQSKSPVVHETHVNKKRNLCGSSGTETTDVRTNTKSPVNSGQKRKTSQSKDVVEDVESRNKDPLRSDENAVNDVEKAPDFIPISTGNHDKQGQIIQDNEVSDTSDVVTSARIYITVEIMEKLNSPEGREWLNATAEKTNVCIEKTDIISFLIIKGTVGDQEAFQTELRDWIKNNLNGGCPKSDNNRDQTLEADHSLSHNIPKNRKNVLQVINKALGSLKGDLGDPKTLFEELNYRQKRHIQLLKQKEISPKQLSNNRANINSIFRKLNMILLGQAGLADGQKHLEELCSLHEKLINSGQNVLTPQMRHKIGQHFHIIFTANPREDYSDLLAKYYLSRNTQLFAKNNKIEKLKVNTKPKPNNEINLLQNNSNARVDMKSGGVNLDNPQNNKSSRILEKTINKLLFYHRRLLKVKPIDATLNKRRMALMNRLQAHIATLAKYRNMPWMKIKKSKKIQEQAQLFLTNV